jgi:hypothetical protein
MCYFEDATREHRFNSAKCIALLTIAGIFAIGPKGTYSNEPDDKVQLLGKSIERQLATAWQASGGGTASLDYFSTEGLRRIRDGMTEPEVFAMAELPNRVSCQVFAFHVAEKRFPRQLPIIASHVVLTTESLASPLMEDVYEYIASSTAATFSVESLQRMESIKARTVSNYVFLVHSMPVPVLEKWFDSRTKAMPADLQACLLDELFLHLPEGKRSRAMNALLDEFGKLNGHALVVHLAHAKLSDEGV